MVNKGINMNHKQLFIAVVITTILLGIALATIIPPIIHFIEGWDML